MAITNPVRQRIVTAARAALSAKTHFRYAEVRPIPLTQFDRLMNGKAVTVTTDCSGFATCCYHRAGAPDPNGLGYNGAGFTGTMLDNLTPIPLSKAHPGDLAVFGATPGKHVVIIVERGSDPACISHGGPGDPKEAPLSHFTGIGPLTVLRGVNPTIVPRTRAKWRVTGDGGRVVGRVGHRSTRWLWELHHRRVVKRQRHKLHYDRPFEHKQTTNPATRV